MVPASIKSSIILRLGIYLVQIASANKTSTICNHEKNYIPFYYIFGDVIPFTRFIKQTASVTVENCLDPEKGITQTKAFSIYFAISFDKYNETIPHRWIKEAEKILVDYQEDSKYWEVDSIEDEIMNRLIICQVMVYLMKQKEVLYKQ